MIDITLEVIKPNLLAVANSKRHKYSQKLTSTTENIFSDPVYSLISFYQHVCLQKKAFLEGILHFHLSVSLCPGNDICLGSVSKVQFARQ